MSAGYDGAHPAAQSEQRPHRRQRGRDPKAIGDLPRVYDAHHPAVCGKGEAERSQLGPKRR